jgi:FAD/FMN-containing dehydrogenase
MLRKSILATGCEVFEPGTDGYARSIGIWNGAVEHRPALIARCLTVNDVQSSLAIAQAQGLEISVRGGGHDWAGRALRDGGLVIDISGMQEVSIDFHAREATVAAGATASQVCAAIASSGLAAVTGNTGAVSLVGLLLGGGYGPLTTRYGLALDSLLEAKTVLADGSIVNASASQNADLFWAIRGGGGNFGVVTSVRVRLHEIGLLLSGVIHFPWEDARSVLRGYNEIMSSAPDELSVAAALATGPDGKPVVVLVPTWSGEQGEGQRIIAHLQSLGTPLMTRVGPMTCSEMLSTFDAQVVNGRHYSVQTRWLQEISQDAISTLIESYGQRTSRFSMVALGHFHGAGTRVAADATAFGLRREHFLAMIYSTWETSTDGDPHTHRQWALDLSSRLASFSLPGGYANVLAPDAHEQIMAAYGDNAARLIELKRQFDPRNAFSSAIPLPDL